MALAVWLTLFGATRAAGGLENPPGDGCVALAVSEGATVRAELVGAVEAALQRHVSCVVTPDALLEKLGRHTRDSHAYRDDDERPEAAAPQEAVDALSEGIDAYYDGRLADAQAGLVAALGELSQWSQALDQHPEWSAHVQEGVLTLARVHLARGDEPAAESTLGGFDRLFPTTNPSPRSYPPEVLERLDRVRGTRAPAATLRLILSADAQPCVLSLNGVSWPLETELHVPLHASPTWLRFRCGDTEWGPIVLSSAHAIGELHLSEATLRWWRALEEEAVLPWPARASAQLEVRATLRSWAMVDAIVVVGGQPGAQHLVRHSDATYGAVAREPGEDEGDMDVAVVALFGGEPAPGWRYYDAGGAHRVASDHTLEWAVGAVGLGVVVGGGTLFAAAAGARDDALACAHSCSTTRARDAAQSHANLLMAAELTTGLGVALVATAATLWLAGSEGDVDDDTLPPWMPTVALSSGSLLTSFRWEW